MISLMLLLFCITPLVKTPLLERKSQIALKKTEAMHQLIQSSYTEIIKKLYENEISFEDIQSGIPHKLDAEGAISYKFIKKLSRRKFNGTQKQIHYLYSLEIIAHEKLRAEYNVYILGNIHA
jgi:hypothetical protein